MRAFGFIVSCLLVVFRFHLLACVSSHYVSLKVHFLVCRHVSFFIISFHFTSAQVSFVCLFDTLVACSALAYFTSALHVSPSGTVRVLNLQSSIACSRTALDPPSTQPHLQELKPSSSSTATTTKCVCILREKLLASGNVTINRHCGHNIAAQPV
jgi:hypothetical protein